MGAATVKKIILRLLIVEVVFFLMTLAITPFLFGSIKPFKPQLNTEKSIKIVSVDYKVATAIKKAEAVKPVVKVAKKSSQQRTIKPVKSKKRIKKANDAPKEEKNYDRTIPKPIGEPIIIGG